jgi:demethylmenaquinone methyltransferase/2-methoxy-6-polyprenyl-1,4-benzoquinol methylase
VTAVDFAEKMIQISKTKYSHLKNVTVKLLDVEKDDLPTETFDAITCFGLFPHLENKEKALQNLNQALKKGGILIIAHALSSEEIKTHHNRTSPPIAKDILPEKTEMKRILKQTGYTEIHIEDKPGYYLCFSKKL